MNSEVHEEVKLLTPWFHGKISREDAEKVLEPNEEGLFLVRESTNYQGDFTLSVCSKSDPTQPVQHYHIETMDGRFTLDMETTFATLPELVAYYRQAAHGLCTVLRDTRPKKGKLDKTDFSVAKQELKNKGWAIEKHQLSFKHQIGKGEFGAVHQGIYTYKNNSGLKVERDVAIKEIKEKSDSAVELVLQEATTMTALRHPCLVELLGVVLGDDSDPTMYLVTEFMAKGNLVDYLRSRGRSVITPKDQLQFAVDTCSGMAYLESKNVVHRDLAARNVLIEEAGKSKISDFGLSSRAELKQVGGKLPVKWTAPEALKTKIFTSKTDVWSYGILLWEIYAFGRVPYPRIPLGEVLSTVEFGYKMESPEGCPSAVYQIMVQCWNLDPELRPTFAQICKALKRL